MKTKIIYICGGESCDIADIRSAFNQVKSTLGLDKETILFGVPIETGLEEINLDKTAEKEGNFFEESPEDINNVFYEDKEIIEEQTDKEEEKVIPILSVLSPKEQEYDKDEDLQEAIEIKDTDEEEIETEEITEEIELDEISSQEELVVEEENVPTSLKELFKTVPSLDEFSDNDTIDVVKEDSEILEEDNITTDKVIELLTKEYMEKQKEIENSIEPANKKSLLNGFRKPRKKQPSFDLFRWAGFPANEEDYNRPSLDDK